MCRFEGEEGRLSEAIIARGAPFTQVTCCDGGVGVGGYEDTNITFLPSVPLCVSVSLFSFSGKLKSALLRCAWCPILLSLSVSVCVCVSACLRSLGKCKIFTLLRCAGGLSYFSNSKLVEDVGSQK